MPEKARLAEVIPPGQSNNLPAMAYYPPFPPQQEFEPETPRFPCRTTYGFSAGIAGRSSHSLPTCILVTAVVSARLKPIYESTATVDVDRQAPSEVVGEGSTRNEMSMTIQTSLSQRKSNSSSRIPCCARWPSNFICSKRGAV